MMKKAAAKNLAVDDQPCYRNTQAACVGLKKGRPLKSQDFAGRPLISFYLT
jgi:hypothetical protein